MIEAEKYQNVIYIVKYCHQFKVTGCILAREINKHVDHENVLDGSSMIRFPIVISDSEKDMPGIEPLGWYTSTLTSSLQEVRHRN